MAKKNSPKKDMPMSKKDMPMDNKGMPMHDKKLTKMMQDHKKICHDCVNPEMPKGD